MPAPPVASTTRARDDGLRPRRSSGRARRRRSTAFGPPYLAVVSRSIAMWSGSIVMRSARARDAREQRRSIARPVMSWRGRRGARCGRPRARASSSPSASRSNGTPSSSAARRMRSGPSRDAELDDVAVAEPVADAQRVLDVRLERVVGLQHAGDAALRVGGVGVGRGALGGDDDAAVLGGAQREVEPREAGPDDQVVGLDHVTLYNGGGWPQRQRRGRRARMRWREETGGLPPPPRLRGLAASARRCRRRRSCRSTGRRRRGPLPGCRRRWR